MSRTIQKRWKWSEKHQKVQSYTERWSYSTVRRTQNNRTVIKDVKSRATGASAGSWEFRPNTSITPLSSGTKMASVSVTYRPEQLAAVIAHNGPASLPRHLPLQQYTAMSVAIIQETATKEHHPNSCTTKYSRQRFWHAPLHSQLESKKKKKSRHLFPNTLQVWAVRVVWCAWLPAIYQWHHAVGF